MIFTEPRFLGFFLLVFAGYWALRRGGSRKALLLGASYLFYAAWDWRFLALIVASTLIDYAVGLRIDASDDERRRRRWLQLSLAGNLGILGFFKYFGFFVDSGMEFLAFLGLPVARPSLEIILPVGISFYTFQTLSYSLDVYRRKLAPTRDLLDLALFVGFFPQLVAGPIVRAAHFLPQLAAPHRLVDVAARRWLLLFLIGFVKKACVSDNVAPFVDQYFAAPAEFTALSAWIATLLYAVQIYCDFSGYSDMAIACAGLLGFDIGVNFDFPYLARDIREFWRRWHISLSGWLRDYLYVPLGGNRGSKLFTYRNLMLTMLLGGLWHGAGWNFVFWGGLHGGALVAHREWSRRSHRGESPRRPARSGGPVPHRSPSPRRAADPDHRTATTWLVAATTLATFWWVCLAWIFFRAQSLADALVATRAFVLLDSPGPRSLSPTLLLLFALLAALHWIAHRTRSTVALEHWPLWGFWPAYGAAAAVALALVRPVVEPFIYFQF